MSDLNEDPNVSAEDSAAIAAAEEAAFAEEFANEEGDPDPAPKPVTDDANPTPSPAPTPSAPTASPAPAPAAQPDVDPYADLPPEIRDVLAELPTLRHEAESNRGRVAALNRTLEETRAELTRVKTAPTPPPEPPRSDKLDKVRGELPEVAEAIEDYFAKMTKAAAPPQQAAPAAPAAPVQSPAPPPATDPELELLNKEYAGWDKKIDSTDFKLWLGRQPAEYQQEVMRTQRSGVLITAMNRFDRDVGGAQATAQPASKVTQQRAGRIAAAVTPQGAARPGAVRASAPQTEEDGFAAEVARPTR